ncbi:hypothetical protein ES703_34666 [subsurface metagenome]
MERIDRYALQVEALDENLIISGHGYSGINGTKWKDVVSLANHFMAEWESDRKRFGGHLYNLIINEGAKKIIREEGVKLLEKICAVQNAITQGRFYTNDLFGTE